MDANDLPAILELKRQFEELAALPGLFHATRVRLDGEPAGAAEVTQHWEEFLGTRAAIGFSCLETPAGPAYQHACFFGATQKLYDYSSLAVKAIAACPLGTVPILPHHRNLVPDRDQWTLGLYALAAADPGGLVLDSLGSGGYARFGVDVQDAVVAVSGRRDAEAHRRYMATLRIAYAPQPNKGPRYIYLALGSDVCSVSAVRLGRLAAEIESKLHAPAPGVLPVRAAGQSLLPWPPDAGWHYRVGEAAFEHLPFRLTPLPMKLLQKLQAARSPVQRSVLENHLWPNGPVDDPSTLRAHIAALRAILRSRFKLGTQHDPVPLVTRAPQAWQLQEDLLREQARRLLKARGFAKERRARTHRKSL